MRHIALFEGGTVNVLAWCSVYWFLFSLSIVADQIQSRSQFERDTIVELYKCSYRSSNLTTDNFS
jgi:hypothetical protein